MEYRAVGNRVAVNFNSLLLPISREEALNILSQKNFKLLEIDLIALARECVGKSKYRRGARFSEAPSVVDCSSFIKWLYAQRGIWLPRLSIQQSEFGERIEFNEIIAKDVIFTSGFSDMYANDIDNGISHVNIATDDKTVVCATKSKLGYGVIEVSQDLLLSMRKFRGAKRYISKDAEIFTFEIPIEIEVETSDDIKWIILQSLF